MEFISKWLTFKEEHIKYQPTYRTDEITWATNSTSRGICEGLNGHTYADATGIGIVGSIVDENNISNTIVINAANTLTSDNTNSILTASDDLPSNCIHVSAKSK